jgi:hypothetical protein
MALHCKVELIWRANRGVPKAALTLTTEFSGLRARPGVRVAQWTTAGGSAVVHCF